MQNAGAGRRGTIRKISAVIALQSSIDQTTLVPFRTVNRVQRWTAPSQPAWQDAAIDLPDTDEVHSAERKLRMLQRSGLFGGDTKGAIIERACSAQDLRTAYRLVHDVYVSTGFIHPDPAGIRLRLFETSPDTATFVAKIDGRVVGVLSVVADSPDFGLPSDTAFRAELDRLRSEGLRMCELTNQVVAPEYRKSAIATELMRCAIAHGMKAGFHQAVAAVSPSHDGFYQLLGFHNIGSVRSYSEEIYDPVVAMAMDLNMFRRPVCRGTATERFVFRFAVTENPYLDKVGEWNRRSHDCFLSVDNLIRLFVREKNFLDTCTLPELQAIQFRWGRKLFSAVIVHSSSSRASFEYGLILSATIVTRSAPARGTRVISPGRGTFVRNLTPCRSRSFHKARRKLVEPSRRTARLHR